MAIPGQRLQFTQDRKRLQGQGDDMWLAVAMKAKLSDTRAKGRCGWDDKDDCTQQHLSDLLRTCADKGDPVDVANFAMFLHQRGDSILPALIDFDGMAAEIWAMAQTPPGQGFGESIDLIADFLSRNLVAPSVPSGMMERIDAAIKRITDGHAPRRIPADPTDADLVLVEVKTWIEGKWPPFWIGAAPKPEAP